MALSIRERRRSLGLSQRALAEQLGVSEDTVAAWESRRNSPTGQRRERVQRWLAGEVDSSDRPTPDDPSGQTPGEGLPQQVSSRLLSASSTDDQMVMTRPDGVSDAEWAEFRAGTWEAYARWLASRAQAAARALERHTGTSSPSS